MVFRDGDSFAEFDQANWFNNSDSVISIRMMGESDSILEKMKKVGKPLETYLEAKVGIKRADAPIRSQPGGKYKPFLLGRDMCRYGIKFRNTHILFDTSLFHTTVDEDIFLRSEKILVRKTGNTLVATLDEKQYYTDQTLYNVFGKNGTKPDLQGILAQLNSKLLYYFFSKVCVTNPDIYPYIKGIHLKQLPILFDGTEKIAGISKRILQQKARNPDSETIKLEEEIDQQIYALFGLTPEEIKIVENASA